MGTNTASTAGVRRTAAAKYTEDTLDIHGLHAELLIVGEELSAALNRQTARRAELRDTQELLTGIKQDVISTITDKLSVENPKVAQAVIDREVKAQLADHDGYTQQSQIELVQKNQLDEAEAMVIELRYHHRALIARSNLLAANLQYLAASKQAAAVAAGGLVGI